MPVARGNKVEVESQLQTLRKCGPKDHARGARKLCQLQDNLASFDLTLCEDQVKTLDEASRIELGFPHDFYGKELIHTFVYGGLREQILA